MRRPAAKIQTFIAAHEDELFEADYRAMLEAELARKKPRATVVKGLRVLIGGELGAIGSLTNERAEARFCASALFGGCLEVYFYINNIRDYAN
jgi:hypothetical protein